MKIEIMVRKEVTISNELSAETGFPVGSETYYFEKIYYGDNLPKSLFKIYFLKRKFPDANMDENAFLPYYEYTEYEAHKYNIKRALQSVRLSDTVNELLRQYSGTAGIEITEWIYDYDDSIIVYSKGYTNINYLIRFTRQNIKSSSK